MANQYGNVTKFVKCQAKGCKNMVRVTPSKIRKGSGKHCSPACAHKSKKPKTFTKPVVKYIMANVATLTRVEMANHLGISRESLSKFLMQLRRAGKDIPTIKRSADIGTIRTYVRSGVPRDYIKTEKGWRSHTPPEKRQKASVKKEKTQSIPKPPAILIQAQPEIPAKTKLLLPNGEFVICDTDKVNSTIKYLQSQSKKTA
jgi:hypothetical protein